MAKSDKKLEKMRNNPKDWQISDLEVIAAQYGISIRKGKGSHMTFSHPLWEAILTVPAHRPLKVIYVKRFVSLVDTLRGDENE